MDLVQASSHWIVKQGSKFSVKTLSCQPYEYYQSASLNGSIFLQILLPGSEYALKCLFYYMFSIVFIMLSVLGSSIGKSKAQPATLEAIRKRKH